MNQNPVYSMSTTESLTTDHEAIQTYPNILYGMNTEANHTHKYDTVDKSIEMNQNPVYNATNNEADYGLGQTRNEQQPEYDYIQVWKLYYNKQLMAIFIQNKYLFISEVT